MVGEAVSGKGVERSIVRTLLDALASENALVLVAKDQGVRILSTVFELRFPGKARPAQG